MCTQLRSVDVRESFGWLLLGVTFYCCVMSSSVEILDSLSAGVSRLYSEIPWTPNPDILYIYVPKYTYIQLDQVVDMNTQGARTSGVTGYKKSVLVNSRERSWILMKRSRFTCSKPLLFLWTVVLLDSRLWVKKKKTCIQKKGKIFIHMQGRVSLACDSVCWGGGS